MKPFFYLLIAGCLLAACGQNDAKSSITNNSIAANEKVIEDSANFTTLQWIDSVHQDLGKVTQGQMVEVSWRFKNTGNKPLVMTNATASCGCTVAEKPEQPVAPGETGVIKAKFDSNGREGEQRKEVYVTANTQGSTTHNLSFRVDVAKK